MLSNAYTDPLDYAAELEEQERQSALALHSRHTQPEQVKDAQGNWETEECIDCGEDIKPARLEMGKVRCFHCQSELEDMRKRGLVR